VSSNLQKQENLLLPTFSMRVSKASLFTLFSILLIHQVSIAQLRLVPHYYKSTQQQQLSAFRIKVLSDPISLPFWDDFSFVGTKGDTLWANKRTVRISDDLAIDPPSVGVAVFDGLNQFGIPYDNDPIANGFRDTLESRKLRLADVALANRDSVYLSFAYQWKGNGEAPNPADYLQLDFKNAEDKWETVGIINVVSSLNPALFYDTIFKVADERFFHNNFKFRILSYGRLSGPFDIWLVDYVYLNEHRFEDDLSFPDRTISQKLSPLFGEYRAVPKEHFFANPKIDTPAFNVQSLQKVGTSVVAYSSSVTSLNFFGGLITSQSNVLDDNIAFGPFNELVGQFATVFLTKLPVVENNTALFNALADSISLQLELTLRSGDNKIPESVSDTIGFDYDSLAYLPIDFRVNDTIQNEYFISDYYAYDDGTAEYSVSLSQPGDMALVRYTMLGNQPDTLTHVYFYFPEIADPPSNIVDFLVYSSTDNGEPGTLLADVTIPVRRPGLDTLFKVRLNNAVPVQQQFFIGWRQPINGKVAIGLDKSSDNGGKIFEGIGGKWLPNTSVTGTLMIRPVFGEGDVVTGIETPLAPPVADVSLYLYPNPSAGTFTVSQPLEIVTIFSVTGQSIPYTQQRENDQVNVTLQQPVQGLIIVTLRTGTKLVTRKLLVR
jgi:hypothetical protein